MNPVTMYDLQRTIISCTTTVTLTIIIVGVGIATALLIKAKR